MKDEVSNSNWEKIYSEGKMLNKYPYDRVVSLTFKYFGHIQDKSKIKVLDLGCGAGNNSWFFAREGFDVTGIDVSKTAIEFVKKRFIKEGLKGRFMVMNFNDLPSLSEQYDLIIDRISLVTQEWNDLPLIMKVIKESMHSNSIFISFFYSDKHPVKRYYQNTQNGRTYYLDDGETRLLAGKRITFIDILSHKELYNQFSIIDIYEHSILPIKNTKSDFKGMAEYITIMKKENI